MPQVECGFGECGLYTMQEGPTPITPVNVKWTGGTLLICEHARYDELLGYSINKFDAQLQNLNYFNKNLIFESANQSC